MNDFIHHNVRVLTSCLRHQGDFSCTQDIQAPQTDDELFVKRWIWWQSYNDVQSSQNVVWLRPVRQIIL